MPADMRGEVNRLWRIYYKKSTIGPAKVCYPLRVSVFCQSRRVFVRVAQSGKGRFQDRELQFSEEPREASHLNLALLLSSYPQGIQDVACMDLSITGVARNPSHE